MPHAHKPTTVGEANLQRSRTVNEQFMQQHLETAVLANAELTARFEDVYGKGSFWSFVPISTLSRKRMHFDD